MNTNRTGIRQARLRSRLLGAAGIALGAALSAVLPRPAHAQMPVTDAGSIAQLVQQVQTASNTLTTLQQSYNRLSQTYEALAHPTNVAGMFPGVSVPGVQNPLGNVGQVPGVVSGTNLGSYGPTAQQFLQQNQVYQPPGTDAAAVAMNQQAQGTAGIQAIAYQNLQATQTRMQQLPAIQAQLDSAQTVQDVAAVNNRLQVEQQFVQTQQAQAQNLALLQKAQEDAASQQDQQRARQASDQLANDTKPLQ